MKLKTKLKNKYTTDKKKIISVHFKEFHNIFELQK